MGKGDRVGVVGWKTLLPEESSGTFAPIFAPAFVVDTLREIAGGAELVVDVTAALTSPRSGLRTFCSADQIAVFEWGASRCSAYVMEILRAARPGVSEQETFHGVPWGGEPLSYHAVLASGPDVAVGLRSPTSRRLELGDAAIAGIGLWGGNCARGGLVAASEDDLGAQSEGYLDGLAVPYWRAMATWYEALELGVSGGDVFKEITELLEGEAFGSSLNPGHLIHYEEWLDSPIRAGSSDPIASGMVFQSDIIPTGIRPGWTANCEDTVAIADAALRAAIESRHPELWSRITCPSRLHARTPRHRGAGTRSCRSRPPRVFPAVLAQPRTSTRLRVNALDGKSVLVTGAARGIGAGVRRGRRRRGRCRRAARHRPCRRRHRRPPGRPGCRALLPCATCGHSRTVERAVAEAEQALGGLDGLVNNAGVNAYFDAVAMSEDDWDSVFAVDLKAAWMLAKAALPGLIERRGAVVNISSIQARLTLRGFFPYAAAKAGLEGLTRSLALDYASAGVRVNAVAPAIHQDPPRAGVARPPGRSGGGAGECARNIPLGRMAEPREIGDAVVFLLSDKASAITGETLAVDCGVGARFAT